MKLRGRLHYIIAIAVGVLLTPISMSTAYENRGYFAIGGECLIIPLLLFITLFIDSTAREIHSIWLEEIKKGCDKGGSRRR